MKIYIIALLLLLACSNKESRTIVHTSEKIDLSINQDDSSSSKKIIMIDPSDFKVPKKFNISIFNQHKDGDEYHFTDKYDMNVRQIVWYDSDGQKIEGYTDERNHPNSGYLYSGYYDPDGFIKSYEISFYDAILKKYNCETPNNFVLSDDYDALYNFTVENLITLFRLELNVDITDSRICRNVERFPDDEFLKCPQYLVYINKSPNSWEYTGYIIHGNTGKILFQINRFINDKRGSLIDNYMETKRK